jgi:CheY-like chemotaxis protein
MAAHKPIILCVDDEDTPLLLRKLVLQKAGYDVLTASSAKEALQIAASNTIDLIVSDHLMPGVTGAELARQLKSEHPKIPIILLSGVNEIPTGAEVADGFLSKVEGPDRLCRTIREALNGSFPSREDK